MADYPAPVAAQIQPPDPTRGLNTFSSILGIRQQEQNLQTGLYQQAAVQAESQQAQQRNTELQQAQQVALSAKNGSFRDAQGNFDRQGMADKIASLGPYAQQMSSSLLSQANEIVANQNAHQQLSTAQQGRMGSALGALANKPGLSNTDFIDTMDQLIQQGVVPPRMALSMLTHLPPNATPQQLHDVAQRWSVASTSPEASASTALPAIGQQFDKSGNLIGTAQNRVSGALSSPQQQPGVQIGLGPTQTPQYQAAVASATTAAGGQASTDNQVFSRVAAAGADSARGIELAQRVEQEAGMVRTGQYTAEFANRLTVLKQHDPSITARQLLQKDAANLKTLAEGTATTDQERQQIGSGFPSPESMDPEAVQKAARYWQGSFRMAGARRDNAMSHVSSTGSTAGLTQSDASFMKNAAPGNYAPAEPKKSLPSGAKLTAYAQAHFGGDTAKASAFLKSKGYE